MKDMTRLARADFDSREWQETIASCERNECFAYCSVFASRSMKALKLGDSVGAAAFDLLRRATLAAVNSESRKAPFYEEWLLEFSDDEVVLMAELAPDISDAEMRARLADLIWTRKRDPDMARLAVDSYIESARILRDQDCWLDSHVRAGRAANIGRMLGQKSEHFRRAITDIERVLNDIGGNDTSLFSAFLMERLQQHRSGDALKYASLSRIAADRALGDHDWDRARRYLFIEAHWYFFGGDPEAGKETRLRMFEAYVEEAMEMVATDSKLRHNQACHRIEQALKGYQDVGGSAFKQRRDELYKLLREYQQKAQEELSLFRSQSADTELDAAGDVVAQRYIGMLKGKSLLQALRILASLPLLPDAVRLRAQIETHLRKSPLTLIFPLAMHATDGRATGRPPRNPSTEEEQMLAEIDAHMFKNATDLRLWKTHKILLPVIEAIKREHRVQFGDVQQVVIDSPFVAVGREHIFALGLQATLRGDYFNAVHLLIPQIENSLRHILELGGVKTSGFNRQDVQNYYDINVMLTDKDLIEKLSSSLGNNIVFELKGLLVHRFGPNLRNNIAHGTLGAAEFNSDFYGLQLIYLCWLTLRLCFANVIRAEQVARAAAS
jgi:hypothetical protein